MSSISSKGSVFASKLRLYGALFSMPIRQQFRYRAEVILSTLSLFITVYIQVVMWTALYANRDEVAGVTVEDMITYVFLSAFLNTFVRSNVAGQLEQLLTTGDIGRELLKPGSLGMRMFVADFGSASYSFLTRVLPVIVLALFWLPIRGPASPQQFAAFLATMFGAMIIAFYLNYFIGLLAFWFLKVIHLRWFFRIGINFFSGATVPLWFFPDWLRTIADYLPFKMMFFVPNSLYLGKMSLDEFLPMLALQWFWIGILVCTGAWMWRRALHRIVIQGG